MNERELSRRLSSGVVDTLKAQGHVLVVKGGAQALARELEELMAPTLRAVLPRLSRVVVMGEVTSTFGDDTVDEAVEELVGNMTRSLMDSDHVEDVFAEDNVIRRDVFRTVRDGIQRAQVADVAGDAHDDEDEEEGDATIVVRLDTLGYVAATVSKLADPKTLRGALEQAAEIVEAELTGFSAETREVTFTMADAGPDARLDLEEAVADELTALVDEGLVDLPTIERVVDIGRATTPVEQKQAQIAVEAIASKTLHRSGCAASWEFEGERSIRVTLTPLSDQDSRDIDQPVSMFARGVSGLFAAAAEAQAPPVEAKPALPGSAERPPVSSKKPASKADPEPTPPSAKPKSTRAAPKSDPEMAPVTKRSAAKKAAKAPASTKAPASPKAPASSKAPASTKAPASAKAPAAKAPAKKAAAKKASAKKR